MDAIDLQFIPLINLRIEVSNYLGLFDNDTFLKQFSHKRRKNDPINTLYESWYGRSELFLTRLLRSCILNIESAVCTCVYFEAAFSDILSDHIKEGVNNPFSLGGRSTTANVYDRLPALVNEDYRLSKSNPGLWERTRQFYREVRNPIFHGKELKNPDPLPVKKSLGLILDLFTWLDSWFDLNRLIKKGRQLSEIPNYQEVIGQIVVPDYVPTKAPKSSKDVMELPNVVNVSGMWLAEYLQFTLETTEDKFMNIRMSPKAAMRMLGYLALAQKHTGWPLPERL